MASSMTSSSEKPQRKRRAKPGSTGEGDYYRIELWPSSDFTFFRNHDVGDKGHLIRVAGKRTSGSWDTVAWLVRKEDAHIEGGETLVGDSEDAKHLIESLGSIPKHVKGDIFEAKDRPNIPEKKKPTEAQKKAWAENIKKAQAARWANKKK
ncbi:MAG TPA: hypothetical protein DCG78_06640 [Anaerolineaceae bacterium]|nr:MAG: hypothetical protein XD89_0733 [Anaerolineae bacterium 49_20]HAE86165.1 hypothetical protein [Anaerolineaceae bacterium]